MAKLWKIYLEGEVSQSFDRDYILNKKSWSYKIGHEDHDFLEERRCGSDSNDFEDVLKSFLDYEVMNITFDGILGGKWD